MTPWTELQRELELWRESGRRAAFWWRDDDAIRPGPVLDELIGISESLDISLGLAVIPARCTPALAERLHETREIWVLQHGFAHTNHEIPERKKCELGPARKGEIVLEELAQGRDRLRNLFEDRSLPVLVPPWNRIAEDLLPALPDLGFRGLSTFTPRGAAYPVPELLQVNCHVDPIRWKPDFGFPGAAQILPRLINLLAAKRSGTQDPEEPIGIMTHHAVHNAEIWDFLRRLLSSLRGHPAVEFLSLPRAFRLEVRS